MKTPVTFLNSFLLIIWFPISNIYGQTSDETVSNPRISIGPAYVKDAVYSHNKTVILGDSSRYDSNKPPQGGVFALAGLVAVPRGTFATNTSDAVGYGLDIAALFNLAGRRTRAEWESRWVNVYAGGNFQYIRQHGTSDRYKIDNPKFTTEITSRVRNNMMGIGAVARVEFFPGKVKLFGEAGAGARVFSGRHRYEVVNTPDNFSGPDDVQTITTNKQLKTALVGNYSIGGGIRISGEVMGVEIKVLSVQGSKAAYVDMESIQFDRVNETVLYATQKSRTDMFLFQIGISGRF